MEKDCYKEIVEEVSNKLADKFSSEEKNLVRRATLIDGDIFDIVQQIGQKTYKKVLEKTWDQIVDKKNPGIGDS